MYHASGRGAGCRGRTSGMVYIVVYRASGCGASGCGASGRDAGGRGASGVVVVVLVVEVLVVVVLVVVVLLSPLSIYMELCIERSGWDWASLLYNYPYSLL